MRWDARGQQTAEYAILFGVAAVVILSGQGIARRAISGVLGGVNQLALERPEVEPFIQADTGNASSNVRTVELGSAGSVATAIDELSAGTSSLHVVQKLQIYEPPRPPVIARLAYIDTKTGTLLFDMDQDGRIDGMLIDPNELAPLDVTSIDPGDLPYGTSGDFRVLSLPPPGVTEGDAAEGAGDRVVIDVVFVDFDGNVVGSPVFDPETGALVGLSSNGSSRPEDLDLWPIFFDDGAGGTHLGAVERVDGGKISETIYVRPQTTSVPKKFEKLVEMIQENNSGAGYDRRYTVEKVIKSIEDQVGDRTGFTLETETGPAALPMLSLDTDQDYRADGWALDTDGDHSGWDTYVRDLNGNGVLDETDLEVFSEDGALTFGSAQTLAPGSPPSDWARAELVDVNRDGMIDSYNGHPAHEIDIEPHALGEDPRLYRALNDLQLDTDRYEPTTILMKQALPGPARSVLLDPTQGPVSGGRLEDASFGQASSGSQDFHTFGPAPDQVTGP